EALSDDELLLFSGVIEGLGQPNEKGEFEEVLEKNKHDSNFSSQQIKIVQGALVKIYGGWAEKLKALGLISETVEERIFEYKEDSERHIDMDGSIREIIWTVHFHKPAERLMKLVNRLSFDITS